MSRIRVYELARELGLESKSLIALLAEHGVSVSSHQSNLTGSQSDKIKQIYRSSQQSTKKGLVVRRRRRKVVNDSLDEKKEKSMTPESSEKILETGREKTKTKEVQSLDESVAKVDETVAKVDETVAKVDEAVADKQSELIEEKAVQASSPNDAKKEKVVEKPDERELLDKPEIGAKKAPVELVENRQEDKKKTQQVSSRGARVVRRATPEEIEELKNQEIRLKQKKENFRNSQLKSSVSTASRKTSTTSDSHHHVSTSAPTTSDQSTDHRKKEKRDYRDSTQRSSSSRGTGGESNSFSRKSPAYESIGSSRPSGRQNKKRVVYAAQSIAQKRKELKRRKNLKTTQITTPRAAYRIVKVEQNAITVAELAKQLSVKASELIKKFMAQDLMLTINQTVDYDTASLMASDYGYECKSVSRDDQDLLKEENPDEENFQLESRPPIITVMGHVDHGKTSLLDVIRKSGVAAKEAGGITQHIGAYTVEKKGQSFTFLDTPGHEAFSAMRARGAGLTDIVILVVAADDGVMPQTKEAIAHAQQSDVPIIVAINKIDKASSNIERIYTALSELGIQSEEWGGTHQFIKVSAVTKVGIDDLFGAIQLQAEMMELKATKEGKAIGVVVEAHLDKSRGPVATIIVTKGTVKRSQFVVAGSVTGRIRGMKDHQGKQIQSAGPSTPVEVVGLSAVPMSSDLINVVSSEKVAKEISAIRLAKQQTHLEQPSASNNLEELLTQAQEKSLPEISLIIKGDVQGTVEAISDSISKLKSAKIKTNIVFRGVGGISESDVNLAHTSKAVILGFNVRASSMVSDIAKKNGVVISYFSVIYEMIDAVKALMLGALPQIKKEAVLGHAEVRDVIRIPKIGFIAGSMVLDGKITRNSQLRLVRDDVVIHDGKLSSLRRFKDDVKEVQTGYECGISFDNYTGIQVGDKIEAYVIEAIDDKLDI